jgi:TadE-like protein
MAIEMVVLAPVLVMFVLVVVAFGRYVAVRGDVEAASRDAVRAASFERSSADAAGVAKATADASLNGRWTCTPTELGGQFAAGDIVSITLSCQVPWTDLGLIGLKGSKTVTATSEAPLDLYRRTGP